MMRLETVKTSDEVTALINDILEPQGWRLRRGRAGWRVEATSMGQHGLLTDNRHLTGPLRVPVFKSRPEAVGWLARTGRASGLSGWMARCSGDLIEWRRNA